MKREKKTGTVVPIKSIQTDSLMDRIFICKKRRKLVFDILLWIKCKDPDARISFFSHFSSWI
jgi:hypothetical protein